MSNFRGVEKMTDIKARSVVDDETGCWNWAAAYSTGDRSQTPVCWSPAAGRVTSVPRLFAFLDSGNRAFIERGNRKLKAWRTCLNPKCVRHIAYGSTRDFGAWATESGHKRGNVKVLKANTEAKRKQSKLSDADINHIRQSNETGRALAKHYEISPSQISRIRRGLSWRNAVANASVFTWRGVAQNDSSRAAA